MKLEMVLMDGTAVELIEASYPQHYVLSCGSRTAFTKIWGKMTDENISEIHIKEDDEEKAIIVGSRLVGTQTVNISASAIIGHFYLDGGDVYGPGEYPPVEEDEEPAEEETPDE